LRLAADCLPDSRENIMSAQTPNPRSLPVVLQPDPALQRRSGTLGTIMASLGMTAVVITVLYGLTRPEAPQQTASAPQTSSGEPAQATPETGTTGQGSSDEPAQQQPGQGKAERSDSATTSAEPGDQPMPPRQ
jgi:hypothetical protein